MRPAVRVPPQIAEDPHVMRAWRVRRGAAVPKEVLYCPVALWAHFRIIPKITSKAIESKTNSARICNGGSGTTFQDLGALFAWHTRARTEPQGINR